MCFNENCFCQNINYNKTNIMTHKYRVATVREKVWKMNFFQVRENSGNWSLSQGKLQKVKKVREFQNFLKRDGLWQCINVLKKFEESELFP